MTSAYHTTIPYRIQTSHQDQFYTITILGIILILIFLLTNILWNTSRSVFANIIFFYSFSYLLFLTKIYKKQATASILNWHANLAQNDFQIVIFYNNLPYITQTKKWWKPFIGTIFSFNPKYFGPKKRKNEPIIFT